MRAKNFTVHTADLLTPDSPQYMKTKPPSRIKKAIPQQTSHTKNTKPKLPHVGCISLGCPKALVDSERILTTLRNEGYAISPTFAKADIVLVNTCGFINAAVEESLAAIGEAQAKHGKVIVTGCLGAQADIIRAVHPAVLAITGPQAYAEVIELVHHYLPPPQQTSNSIQTAPPVKLTPKHYAYLKIAEGCDHHCSFCIIPKLRGQLVSQPIGTILHEAENLVHNGVRELLVIAQDSAAYGRDLKHRTAFYQARPLRCDIITLARELGNLPTWVRLHYLYPYPNLEQLVTLMADGHILPYLDMPLQHANLRLLHAMRRPAATATILQRLENWRRICPQLTVRSTFIVGFPGETTAEFTELLEFLQTAQLDRVGCFPYSPVANAAANTLADAIPEELKQERCAQLMEVQAQISHAKLAQKIGQRLTVLVDRVETNQVIARSSADAPEIDGNVIIDGAWELDPGDFLEVIITAADDHDLWGQPVECD